MGRTVPQPTKPQLALYAAFAIAVLLIGSRFLREGMGAGGDPGAASPAALDGSGGGVPDGTSAAAAGPSADGGLDAMTGEPGAGDPATGALEGGEAGGLLVDVKGAVRRPGVYRLATGDRAIDAVRRAGGMTGRADRLGVNLAARLTDGGEVVVPRRGAGGLVGAAGGGVGGRGAVAGAGGEGGSAATDAGAAGAPLQLDLNTATAQELEQLDGVGPATAAKIVAYREQHGGFTSIEQLDEVSGIGEAKLAAIRAQLGR